MTAQNSTKPLREGKVEGFPSIRCISGRQHNTRIAVRIGLALIFFASSFARSASANVIYVTTLTDKVSGTGGCSLKEAIYSATLHDTLDGVHGIAIDYTIPDHFITTGCEIGSGTDTIILPTGAVPPTFQLLTDTSWDAHNPYGPTATPIINSNITIQGYGATLQWVGTGSARLFAVGFASITTPNGVSSGTGSLTLLNVHVTGFQAKGGNGADGGGGGLGAGGAIYVQNGNLTIETSTFDSNVATGGNGGGYYVEAGGGGGLGGNGGPGALNGFGEANGGGGGGSRGNGGSGEGGGGGGGGGTVNSGTEIETGGGSGGYLCGGNGGDASANGNNGHDAKCAGGGAGGDGGLTFIPFEPLGMQSGANGAYGGGGSGGEDYGGSGGFGAGGGAGSGESGGSGGFGGGGGAGSGIFPWEPGSGGQFGGNGASTIQGGTGGGGAALGGVIFSDGGSVLIENSTFANNQLFNGQGGVNGNQKADNGGAAGGAIFARDGSVTIIDSTISGNQADGFGAGLVVYSDGSANLRLEDTIIANNGANECYVSVSGVNLEGAGNLIMSNSPNVNACPGVVVTADPQLGPLQLNSPGITPTMAISTSSSAFNAADPTTSLATDQRGVDRPQDGGFDIGAYEACAPPIRSNPNEVTCVVFTKAPPPVTVPLTIQVSPAGGGTTSPTAGVTEENEGSVIIATATPNPGYYFGEWFDSLGNLLTTESSLGVVMNSPLTIEAVFFPCGCAADVTNAVTVTLGPIVLNPVTKHYAQTVTVKNNSANTLAAPISLVLQNLTESVTLNNQSGVTTYVTPRLSPFISTNVNLAPGQSTSFALQFLNPANEAITYTTRVLAGSGVI
jgi:CSLREA domain-containing protein